MILDDLTSFVSSHMEEISGCSKSMLILLNPSSSQNRELASKT
jgi:hypothetical protein